MKATWLGMAAAAAVLVSGYANAADEAAMMALAQKSACMSCHGMDKKIVGPGYKEVAAKYKGDSGAAAKLAAKVKAGGKGVWGEVPMPPNAGVSDANAKALVDWILTRKY
jgi:cytochrome c